jgi:hypothetical protein
MPKNNVNIRQRYPFVIDTNGKFGIKTKKRGISRKILDIGYKKFKKTFKNVKFNVTFDAHRRSNCYILKKSQNQKESAL